MIFRVKVAHVLLERDFSCVEWLSGLKTCSANELAIECGHTSRFVVVHDFDPILCRNSTHLGYFQCLCSKNPVGLVGGRSSVLGP